MALRVVEERGAGVRCVKSGDIFCITNDASEAAVAVASASEYKRRILEEAIWEPYKVSDRKMV